MNAVSIVVWATSALAVAVIVVGWAAYMRQRRRTHDTITRMELDHAAIQKELVGSSVESQNLLIRAALLSTAVRELRSANHLIDRIREALER